MTADLENHPWRLAAVAFVATFATSLGFLTLALDASLAFAAAYSIAFATVFSIGIGLGNSWRLRRHR